MNEKKLFQKAFLDEVNLRLKTLFQTEENAVIIERREYKEIAGEGFAYIMPPLNCNWCISYFQTGIRDIEKETKKAAEELAEFFLQKALNDSKL